MVGKNGQGRVHSEGACVITVLETQYDTVKEFKLHKKFNNYVYLDKTPFCMLFSEDTQTHKHT